LRKSNSDFRTAFVSETGSQLVNNDYFAFVELDDYACYVIASGITDFKESQGAKRAVENILLSFQEQPGMSKMALKRYLQDANDRLVASASREKLRASVVVVVTDYEKMRYASAGNARLRMYRQGRMKIQSKDQSLAQDLVDQGKSVTTVAKSRERNNLYAYLGKRDDFTPFISPQMKLMDADIISLYTEGIWENVDEGELDDVFVDATNEPQESVDYVEELLLSRQPQDLRNYTMAAIFVNRVFSDPERARKRRRRIRLAIAAAVLFLMVGGFFFYRYHAHQTAVREMYAQERRMLAYCSAENFVRAQKECDDCVQKATRLEETAEAEKLEAYQQTIDAIVQGDDAFRDKDFETAYDRFQSAKELSRQSDMLGSDYIDHRIHQSGEHLSVDDLISLGDHALESGDLDKAEDYYFQARDKAEWQHYAEGKKRAIEALNKLYDAKAKQLGKQDEASKALMQAAISKGDSLLSAGDYKGAEAAYLEARRMAAQLGDKGGRDQSMSGLESLHKAQGEAEQAMQKKADDYANAFGAAAVIETNGDRAAGNGNYSEAVACYNSAYAKYTALREYGEANNVSDKLASAQANLQNQLETQASAKSYEDQARNLYAAHDYDNAKQAAEQAKAAYQQAGNSQKASEMDTLLASIAADTAIAAGLPQ